MKRLAVIVVLVLLAAAGWWVWSSWRSSSQVLVTDATAVRLEGESDTLHVFLTIENRGAPETVVAAMSTEADATELYMPESESGLPLPAGGKASMAADGAHVIMKGIHGAIADGRLFPVRLIMDDGTAVTAKARLGDTKSAGHADHVGLFGIGDICTVGEGEPAPKIALNVEPSGNDGGWTVNVVAQDFTFDKSLVDGPHVPGTGHAHLYVDGLKIGRLYEPVATVGALPPGEHIVRVTLNTNDHRAYVIDDKPVTAQAVIKVD